MTRSPVVFDQQALTEDLKQPSVYELARRRLNRPRT